MSIMRFVLELLVLMGVTAGAVPNKVRRARSSAQARSMAFNGAHRPNVGWETGHFCQGLIVSVGHNKDLIPGVGELNLETSGVKWMYECCLGHLFLKAILRGSQRDTAQLKESPVLRRAQVLG